MREDQPDRSKSTTRAIRQRARELCILAGDDPDAIGEPSVDSAATLDHAFPRWVRYQRQAREEMEIMAEQNPPTAQAVIASAIESVCSDGNSNPQNVAADIIAALERASFEIVSTDYRALSLSDEELRELKPPTGTSEAMAEAVRRQRPASPTRFFYFEQRKIKDGQ